MGLTNHARNALYRTFDTGGIGVGEAVKIVGMEWPDDEFDLKHNDRNIWPHIVWQRLFKVYRAFRCPVENMHDMLCDFNNIQRLFEIQHLWYEFYWYFDPGYYTTIFDVKERYDEHFGVHVRGTPEGEFKMRYLFWVSESESDKTDHVRSALQPKSKPTVSCRHVEPNSKGEPL
jgi:hypothetical protein